MIADGMSQVEIGRALGVHPKTVSTYGKRLGVKFHHGRKRPERRAEVMRAVAQGCRNCREVAEVVMIHHVQAHRYVRELADQGLLKFTGRGCNTRLSVIGKWA